MGNTISITSTKKTTQDSKYVGYGRDAYLAKMNSSANRATKKKDMRKLVSSGKIIIGEPVKDSFVHLEHVGREDAHKIKV